MTFPPIPNNTFPSLAVTKSVLPDNFDASTIDATAIAQQWFSSFAMAVAGHPDPKALLALFVPESTGAQIWWRDMLALTWDFRTFVGPEAIHRFAIDRLTSRAGIEEVQLHDLKLELTASDSALPPTYTQATADIVWIQFFFSFKTASNIGSGIVRIVPVGVKDAASLADVRNWKAHAVYTNLEGLINHPESTGANRDSRPNHGLWHGIREKEVECEGEDEKPTVLIVGGGHCGLGLAARLKMLGLKSLIIEQNERVGDNWRNRYEALCLHDPVWYDHMPYLRFPPNWPVYTPALKLANWLEHYAEVMELNVWLASTVQSVHQDPETGKWDVSITRTVKSDNGTAQVTRHFTSIHHIVMATGFGSGMPEIPRIKGMDVFQKNGGTVLHSTQHKRAEDHKGRKVIVVGACTSAHDIASDYYHNGVDVTIFQRSSTYIMSVENGWKVFFGGLYSEDGPPVDIADRLSASSPLWAAIPLNQIKTARVAELDKELLEGLHKVGFKTNLGYHDSGFGLLALGRGGGYYFDTGASGLIAEGKIRLKSGAQIQEFNEHGLKFDDGSELAADVVVFATGLGEPRKRIAGLVGEELASQAKALWGFSPEGEINGAWKDIGIRRFWYMIGNLSRSRFHSKHVALQIKAQEEGLMGVRYSE